MWLCPYVDSAFGVRVSGFFGFLRACFDVDTSHIFPQGKLNGITLLG